MEIYRSPHTHPTPIPMGIPIPTAARYWSKIVNISYPLAFDAPFRGSLRNIGVLFGRPMEQELSYRKQIARQLRTQYAEGICDNPVTLKSRLTVTGSGTIE